MSIFMVLAYGFTILKTMVTIRLKTLYCMYMLLQFATELVRLGYQRVCVLHKGIDVLRSTNVLTVPPVDL